MPLIYRHNIDDVTSLGVWKIEEEANFLEKQLQLKDHELRVLRSLNGEKRNIQWLATRVLLRKMLNTEAYIDCQTDEHGKPFLVNLPYHISLSHSYEHSAVIISKNKKVGIDIELIKNKIERIAGKFLSPLELQFINDDKKILHLYACWCVKEALYKLNGKKETSFKDNIHLQKFNYYEEGNVFASIDKGEMKRNYKVIYKKFGAYMLGYVCD